MVVERQRVSYQPPKSVSLVRFLRDEPAENARSEEDGTAIDDCTAARPGRRARLRLSILLGDFGRGLPLIYQILWTCVTARLSPQSSFDCKF